MATNHKNFVIKNGLEVTNGKVGIGTSTPAANSKLNVYGQIYVTDPTYGSGRDIVINANSNGNTQSAAAEGIIAKANGDLRLLAGSTGWQANRADVLIKNSGDLELSSKSTNDIIFKSHDTENLRVVSDGKVRIPDDGKFTAGAGDDLQIYHNGTHSYIDDAGTGNLYIRSGTLPIQNLAGTKTSATFNSGGGQEFRFDNVIKFATTNTGVTVTGTTTTTGLTVSNDASINGITFGHGNNDLNGNILIGDGLSSVTSGSNNIAIGTDRALESNTTGGGNIAIGPDRPLWNNTTGTGNIAIGADRPLAYNTTGSGNIAIGDDRVLHLNTTGSGNIALGRDRIL